MKLIKDYECVIHYHPERASAVADALSLKSAGILACIKCYWAELCAEMIVFGVEFEQQSSDVMLAHFRVTSLLLDRIQKLQM